MKCFKFTFLFSVFSVFALAQENLKYQKPSPEIMQLADFERTPSVMMNETRDWLVFSYRPTYKALEDLYVDEMKLAGIRINPGSNIGSRVTYVTNLKIRKITDKTEKQVEGLPQNPKIANMEFSPDEKKLAFTNTTKTGVELWILDLASGKAKKIASNLNAILDSSYDWLNNSTELLVKLIPKNRPKIINQDTELPTGPTVSSADGKVSQNATYQDLLKNPIDEANFETLATSELAILNINGRVKPYKTSNMYRDISLSPDGKYVLITTIKKPFSYIVPYNRFPTTTEVFDLKGNLIKLVNETPLNEVQPKGFSSTFTGKRSMNWRPDKPASLYYVMALDGGDQYKAADFRDELFTWDLPFNQPAESLMKTKQRYGGINFGNKDYVMVYDNFYDTRSIKTYLLNPTTKAVKEISDRNSQDRYNDPGTFNTEKNEFGRRVIAIKNNKAYLRGDGFTKEGQFPFVNEYDFATNTTQRIYTSKLKDEKEDILDILDMDKGIILVSLESKNKYPNYYYRNIKTNSTEAITQFQNPFKSLENVYKEVITYKRNDGVELQGTLYLPANYDFKNKPKLPLLIWAYPREFKDKATAGQIIQNPNSFTYPSYVSFVYWVTKGYAVLDDASFPIIGEGNKEPNDTFLPQLVANGKAAIDAVDQLGYIDRKKVAVGGHSYGAFMTANLLTHSKDFACGIARSGAYNRTLTPFGFQSEQRNYWDVPDIYNNMSPFMHADQMKLPLLLIHGEADNNPGTFTLQTERYYQALKNLGAPVRMVLLPKEAHSYVAKDNIFHLLWEQDQFLEKCLK